MKIQSISDIVTNSSSEVFIVTGDKKVLENMIVVLDRVWEAVGLQNLDGYLTGIFPANYRKRYWDFTLKKESLVIEGTSDNSIPYWFMELIECGFDVDVERHHLG